LPAPLFTPLAVVIRGVFFWKGHTSPPSEPGWTSSLFLPNLLAVLSFSFILRCFFLEIPILSLTPRDCLPPWSMGGEESPGPRITVINCKESVEPFCLPPVSLNCCRFFFFPPPQRPSCIAGRQGERQQWSLTCRSEVVFRGTRDFD